MHNHEMKGIPNHKRADISKRLRAYKKEVSPCVSKIGNDEALF